MCGICGAIGFDCKNPARPLLWFALRDLAVELLRPWWSFWNRPTVSRREASSLSVGQAFSVGNSLYLAGHIRFEPNTRKPASDAEQEARYARR